MNKEEIIKILEEVGEEAKQKYKAEIRGLFGSYVRGKETENSDVDVLVDLGEGADLYFGIDYDLVWQSIKYRIPKVKPLIIQLIADLERNHEY